MKRGPLAITVSLSLMVSVALASTAGAFGGRGGRGGGGASGGRPSGFHQSGLNHGFKGSGFKGFKPGFNGFRQGFNGFRPEFNGGYNRSFPGLDSPGFRGFHGFRGNAGFGSFIPWGATTSVWPSGPSYDYGYAAPMYYPATYYAPANYPPASLPPAPYAPPASGSISVPPVPPAATVVSFPGGRYELRGDGITAPYQWVWVPNSPPVPPPPPTAPPAAAPEGVPGAARRQAARTPFPALPLDRRAGHRALDEPRRGRAGEVPLAGQARPVLLRTWGAPGAPHAPRRSVAPRRSRDAPRQCASCTALSPVDGRRSPRAIAALGSRCRFAAGSAHDPHLQHS